MSYRLHAYNSNSTIKNLSIEGTSYTGAVVISAATETLSNIQFKRYWIRDDIAAGDRSRWAFLLHNTVECTFENGLVEDIYWEHAAYIHSPRGNLTFRNHKARRCGAQDIQVVWRITETDDPNGWQHTGLHLVEDGETIECGLPRGAGRASYPISMFGKQIDAVGSVPGPRSYWDCPVSIRRRKIHHTTAGQPAGWELNGAILVEWRPEMELAGVDVQYQGAADQDLIHSYMNERVIVRSDTLNGVAYKPTFYGQRFFDIQGVAAGRTKLIDIEPCDGDVRLRVDGVVKGPLSAGYRWTA